jgi:hypothetical protein
LQDVTKEKDGMDEQTAFKLRKIIPPGVPEELEALAPEELKKRIVDSESNVREAEQSRDNDEHLQAARQVMKDLSEPYREAIKVQRAMQRYALLMLESKGKI